MNRASGELPLVIPVLQARARHHDAAAGLLVGRHQLTFSTGGFGVAAAPDEKLQPICVAPFPQAPMSVLDPDDVPFVLPVPLPGDPAASWYIAAYAPVLT